MQGYLLLPFWFATISNIMAIRPIALNRQESLFGNLAEKNERFTKLYTEVVQKIFTYIKKYMGM